MLIQTGRSTESIVNVDHDVIATVPSITDDDMLEKFQTHQAESDEEGNDCDGETVSDIASEQPSRLEVESALNTPDRSQISELSFKVRVAYLKE